MKVYQLIGTGVDGGDDWDCTALYTTRERAEKQKEIEIQAYTTVGGVVMFQCPFEFEIKELEVEE